jgi:hypothetical protein
LRASSCFASSLAFAEIGESVNRLRPITQSY